MTTTAAMNQDVKAMWLSALRSGKYEQTTGTLHRYNTTSTGHGPGFCCLGVLCDIAVKNGAVPEPVKDTECGNYRYGVNPACDLPGCHDCKPGAAGGLPPEVRTWSGLQSEDGGRGFAPSLAELNDSGDYDFAAIADIIEAEF